MNDVKLTGMRELNFHEIEEVSGGLAPAIAGALWLAGGFGVGVFARWTTSW